MQRETGLADADGVAGVRPAAIARHDVHALGQEIDDFPLPLVTPLRADHHEAGHGLSAPCSVESAKDEPAGVFLCRDMLAEIGPRGARVRRRESAARAQAASL